MDVLKGTEGREEFDAYGCFGGVTNVMMMDA
jgi:hypothetical protein